MNILGQNFDFVISRRLVSQVQKVAYMVNENFLFHFVQLSSFFGAVSLIYNTKRPTVIAK
jgi:hypothetical protein